MGKRARKTRWRALDIADDHSDSEESNTNSSVVSSRYSRSNSNGYFSKYSYSSQSTPARRRYNQYDGSTKSTRSSSTTSETKITFNEDEYTRITTPRQDVLFKKGYLNKPKIFNTQTSTGNSTISTGTSTENGTPDHQSTDLDYESQFVFSNGFVDQNGIYYVNSYEPYPLMLFNPPTYYPEFSSTKSKKHSTGSWSESMSPNNEEATSQDLSQSGGEASTSGVSDYSGGPAVFNMVYPGYYVNGACTPTELANGHQSEPVKKLKKRRERKSSKTIPGDSSEFTDENSGDETPLNRVSIPKNTSDTSRVELTTCTNVEQATNQHEDVDQAKPCINNPSNETANDQCNKLTDVPQTNGCADQKTDDVKNQAQTNSKSMKCSVLKPDAEEFIPRAYQHIPHLKMMPPNFMPIPLVPIGEYGTQNFVPHPAFISPGIPINFIPHHIGQKMFPPPHGFVSYASPMIHEPKIDEVDQNEENNVNEMDRESTATPSHTPVIEECKVTVHSKTIDIATVVSKLEAVKKQEVQEIVQQKQDESVKPTINEAKPFRAMPRFTRAKNICNKYNTGEENVEFTDAQQFPTRRDKTPRVPYRNSPTRQTSQQEGCLEKYSNGSHIPKIDYSNQVRSSSERFQKRTWRPNGYQKNTYGQFKPETINHSTLNKNYPESLKSQTQKPKVIYLPAEEKDEIAKTKSNSQWISVSGRKRKKNVKLDDSENDFNEENGPNDVEPSSDLFETYDVNQLVDVIPPSQLVTPEVEDKRIEDILTSLAETEVTDNSIDSQIVIPEVSAIEKDIIQELQTNMKQELVEVGKSEPEKEVYDDCEEKETFKPKKKSKKGTQKPLTKKIIITDIFDDLSVSTIEATPAVKPVAKKVEVKVENTATEEVIKESSPNLEVESSEKKAKKKRKKNVKVTAPASDSVVDVDSYDTILESKLTGEGQKSTDEISLELDKLIQKGMYNSLHEKFKMINAESDMDPFFQSIGSVLAPSIKDKSAALKAPDFNRIFQSTRQFLKPNMVSVEHDIKVDDCGDNKTYSSDADAADPSSGLDVNEADENSETPVEVVDNDKNLYPITQAVKEWMSKTREVTPEVEILKSPSTIQMEFSEIVSHGQDEEEIVLFSSEDQSDLLEYWDDIQVVSKDCDLTKDIVDIDEGKLCADGKSCDNCRTDSIAQDDDEIAVYESKYGQNEAFLNIQKEVSQKSSQPKQLPYTPRAVCCSIQ